LVADATMNGKKAIDRKQSLDYLALSTASNNYRVDNTHSSYEEEHLKRQLTRGAEVLKLIIKESVSQNKSETIADSAISIAKSDYWIDI
jgi:hypothetical protein